MHAPKANNYQQLGLIILRVTLSLLIAIHGWHRALFGDVLDFGQGLEHRGYPFGIAIAYTITGLEMFGSIIYAWGRLIMPLSVAYICIYCTAIAIYHLPHGWFSSGTDADGCEYAVLLVMGFLCVALQNIPIHAGKEKMS